MSWVYITIDTLNEAKVADLIAACSTAALATAQPDRAEGIIQGVVNEVRTAVASCAANHVDADVTKIPQGLRDLTVDLIIARLKATVEIPLTEDERDNISWRRKQLAEVAACKLVVDQPENPIDPPVESPVASPSFGTRCPPRQFTRRKQDGI